MAVRARYGGVAAAYEVEAPMRAMRGYDGPQLTAAVGNDGYGMYGYDCAAAAAAVVVVSGGGAQSDVTCNNGRGGGGILRSRKRGREEEVELERYVSPSSALLPIPGMAKDEHVPPMPAVGASAAATWMVESAMASTSGRPSAAVSAASSLGGALVSELWQHGAEIDALVRVECERVRAGVEQARKRQCLSLVRAVTAAAARRVREKEAELDAARRRAADLEVRLRQALAESQAWCGLARSNEAIAAGLRHTLDSLLRAAPAPAPAEGFGESDFTSPAALAAADDAKSCCFEAPKENAGAHKWACKACGEGEATVLLLPCRHLCLCKACEPRLDACPVCLAAKNTCVVARSATEF